MLKIIIPITTFVSLCSLTILLNVTTPVTAGPFGILFIFIFAYIVSLGLVTFILYGINHLAAYLSTLFITSKPLETLTLRRSYLLSSVIAAAPIMLICLRSVGEVGIYGYLLVIFFIVIGCLYISKRIH